MKKNVIVFGLTSGILISTFMAFSMAKCYQSPAGFEGSMLIGFASMIIAFSFVFIGIKNQRDKYYNGTITFGQAFKTGFLISLIASTMYVVVWAIEYNYFMPDFMEKYTEFNVGKIQESGATQAEINEKLAEMSSAKEMYKNPFWFTLFTYFEILPVGLAITVLSALILKRKPKSSGATGALDSIPG